MDLLKIAGQLFINKMGGGSQFDLATVITALQQLLPTKGADLDIASLVSKFIGQGGGLAAMASSWLSDGANQSIDAGTIFDVLGQNKVSEFANKLNIGTDVAAGGLADIIPSLIDKSSEGGSLINTSTVDLGKKLLGSLF